MLNTVVTRTPTERSLSGRTPGEVLVNSLDLGLLSVAFASRLHTSQHGRRFDEGDNNGFRIPMREVGEMIASGVRLRMRRIRPAARAPATNEISKSKSATSTVGPVLRSSNSIASIQIAATNVADARARTITGGV